MYNTFWLHALFVQGQLFSVKICDRLRIGCQVIRLGVGDDFPGPSRQVLPLTLLVSLSCTRSFLRPLLPSGWGVLILLCGNSRGVGGGGGSSISYKKSRVVEQGS